MFCVVRETGVVKSIKISSSDRTAKLSRKWVRKKTAHFRVYIEVNMLNFYRIKREVKSTEANFVTNSQQPRWSSMKMKSLWKQSS